MCNYKLSASLREGGGLSTCSCHSRPSSDPTSVDDVDRIESSLSTILKVKIQNEILRVKKTKEKIFIGKKGVSISCRRTVGEVVRTRHHSWQ